MNEHDDDEVDHNGEEEFEVYEVDDETRLLIETACNCLVTLAEAQIQDEAKQGLIAVADSLAERFDITRMELEQHHHQTDDGEEVLLSPPGGVFPEPPEEGEAPADKA